MEEIRTYISEDENTEASRSTIKQRVPSVSSVEAETWQEAKEKFKDLNLI